MRILNRRPAKNFPTSAVVLIFVSACICLAGTGLVHKANAENPIPFVGAWTGTGLAQAKIYRAQDQQWAIQDFKITEMKVTVSMTNRAKIYSLQGSMTLRDFDDAAPPQNIGMNTTCLSHNGKLYSFATQAGDGAFIFDLEAALDGDELHFLLKNNQMGYVFAATLTKQ